MVIGVRKSFGLVLGLALVGSLLGGPAAVGAPTAEDEAGLSTYSYNDIALAPNVAPAGSPLAARLDARIGPGVGALRMVEVPCWRIYLPRR